MSDKPIPMEGVRADQIKVGDRMLGTGGIWEAVRIDVIYGCGTREFRMDRGMKLVLFDDDPVARILPEPVEVREFWRAECAAMIKEGTEQECRDWIKEMDYKSTLDQVAEIIKSRKEVKP